MSLNRLLNDIPLSSWISIRLVLKKTNKTRVHLLEAFGEEQTGHPPSLEFKLGWPVSEDDHWAHHSENDPGICSIWEALNFGHKAVAWDTSQREETFITKARADENGAILIWTEWENTHNRVIACPLSNRGAYLPLEPRPYFTYLQ